MARDASRAIVCLSEIPLEVDSDKSKMGPRNQPRRGGFNYIWGEIHTTAHLGEEELCRHFA
jgi:hypothetical protein